MLSDLEALTELGLDTFDCADIYTGVEALFGEFRRRYQQRSGADAVRRLRFHTKLVPDRSDLERVDRRYVERIVDRSLRRLGVERLDLVQLAWWDYDIPAYVDVAQWLDELRAAGKVRHLGATNFDAERLREILDAGVGLVVHQVQYSLLDRRPETAMVPLCRERGVHLIAYGALAGGLLTDRYLDAERPREPFANRSLRKYDLIVDEFGSWERFQALLGEAHTVARGAGATLAQVALRYVLDRPGVAAALVGLSGLERMRESADAAGLRLGEPELERLGAFGRTAPGPAGPVFGLEREPGGKHAAIMKYDLNREAPD